MRSFYVETFLTLLDNFNLNYSKNVKFFCHYVKNTLHLIKFKNHNMSYLFSNKLKKISGVIFYLSIPIGLFLLLTDRIQDLFVVNVFSIFSYEWIGSERTGFGWIENGLGDEIFTLLIIISGLVNSFSKEKIEDELISRIRLESLSLSLFISFGLIIISTFLVYNLNYMYVLVFNLFLIIFLFNLIFKFRLFKHYKS